MNNNDEVSFFLLVFYLLLALVVSFLCSLVEAGLLSLTRADIARLTKAKRPSGRILERMKKNVDRPLAAILTLNTIAHTVGAAGVGAESQRIWGEEWIAVTSGVLTFLILVFSEIIPKTIGAVYHRRLGPSIAYLVQGMIFITWPLTIAFQALSKIITPNKTMRKHGLEELALMAEVARVEGNLDLKTYDVIRNLEAIITMPVRDVLTPRTVVVMLRKDMTVDEALSLEGTRRFSRLPVQGNGPDDIIGLVLRVELYECLRRGQGDQKIIDMVKPIHAIPEQATVAGTLQEHIRRREQLFLVVDEYGGTAGIVTLEDNVESLIGEEIVDETDAVTDMRALTKRMANQFKNPRQAGSLRTAGADDNDKPGSRASTKRKEPPSGGSSNTR
ncbi:MAG: CNNM domain-containing protein [Planctomycetota bacterium]|jgi:CBS domain containing-hemolysin-like protein